MKKKIVSCLICGLAYAMPGVAAEGDGAVAGAISGGPALAASAPVQDEWAFSVTPYFWAAGLSGKVSQPRLPAIDIHADFDKLFDNLDFGAMLIGDARKGRYSIFGDLIYTKIGSQGDTPRDILATSADVKTSTFAGLLGVGYSVLENSPHQLDVVAGLRVWSVDTDVTLKGGFLEGRKRSDSATWVDALVGVRGNYNLSQKVYLTGWGLVGAGGAEADWDVGLGLGYNFSKSISAAIGYRAVGVDYDRGGFKFDAVLQGPMAGLTIRF
ncbi:hypothetical protein D3C87_402690 [compost metagenome]|jgi:hypothetical protein|uniref:DUF481 domain-containing protein n=1 Tax=Achromobacter sp. Root83 TaxID=1736602 RepID=UPI000710C337|nr:DUF481 domain-containing protein [Achromobacter sp. Root83]KRC84561.1 hypothetical protein ASE30_22310 [Achromobacter sp. Root83]